MPGTPPDTNVVSTPSATATAAGSNPPAPAADAKDSKQADVQPAAAVVASLPATYGAPPPSAADYVAYYLAELNHLKHIGQNSNDETQKQLLVWMAKANQLERINEIGRLKFNVYKGAFDQLIAENFVTEAAKLIRVFSKNHLFRYDNQKSLDEGLEIRSQQQQIVIKATRRYVAELNDPKTAGTTYLQTTLQQLIPVGLDAEIIALVFDHFAKTSDYEAAIKLNDALVIMGKIKLTLDAKTSRSLVVKLAENFHRQCMEAETEVTQGNATKVSATTASGALDQKHTTSNTSAGSPATLTTTQSQPEYEYSKAAQVDISRTFTSLLYFHEQLKLHPEEYNAFIQEDVVSVADRLLKTDAIVEKSFKGGLRFLSTVPIRSKYGVSSDLPIAKTVIEFDILRVPPEARDKLLTSAEGETRGALIQVYSANCQNIIEFNQFVTSYGVKGDWHCIAKLDKNSRINVATFNAVLAAIVKDDRQDTLKERLDAVENLFAIYQPTPNDESQFEALLNRVIDNGKFVLARTMLINGGHLLPAKERIPALAQKLVTKYKSVSAAQKTRDADDAKADSTIDYDFVFLLDVRYSRKKINENITEYQRELEKYLLMNLIAVETDHHVLCKEFLALNGEGLHVPLLQEQQGLIPSSWLTGMKLSASWHAVQKAARIKAADLVTRQLKALSADVKNTDYSDKKAVDDLFKSIGQARLTANVLSYDGDIAKALKTVCVAFRKKTKNNTQQLMPCIAELQDLYAHHPEDRDVGCHYSDKLLPLLPASMPAPEKGAAAVAASTASAATDAVVVNPKPANP